MKTVCILSLLFVIGCSTVSRPTASNSQSNNTPLTILQNLEYFDALSAGVQHPLICSEAGGYPDGRELTFEAPGSTEMIHAVFPATVSPPSVLKGKFVLRGRFQRIQKKRDGDWIKRPGDDYQYFLVTSWEKGK